MLCLNSVRKLYGYSKLVKFDDTSRLASRNFSNFRGTYKVIHRGATDTSDDLSGGSDVEPNWELFRPEGFRFFLPGGIGPGWHDDTSLRLLTSGVHSYEIRNFHFEAQDCPSLLRPGFHDLFPVPEILGYNSPITVINVTLNKTVLPAEEDAEHISKHFVCIAEDLCQRLKQAGFWADFINPFSGQARYAGSHSSGSESIGYLESLTEDCGSCQIISARENNNVLSSFVGTLYTNASRETPVVKEILALNNY